MRQMPVPAALANAPELLPGLEVFYRAFLDLHSSRAVGWDIGPIPWVAVDRYAEAMGFSGDGREDLHQHVRAMDDAYLKWARERKAKEPKSK